MAASARERGVAVVCCVSVNMDANNSCRHGRRGSRSPQLHIPSSTRCMVPGRNTSSTRTVFADNRTSGASRCNSCLPCRCIVVLTFAIVNSLLQFVKVKYQRFCGLVCICSKYDGCVKGSDEICDVSLLTTGRTYQVHSKSQCGSSNRIEAETPDSSIVEVSLL